MPSQTRKTFPAVPWWFCLWIIMPTVTFTHMLVDAEKLNSHPLPYSVLLQGTPMSSQTRKTSSLTPTLLILIIPSVWTFIAQILVDAQSFPIPCPAEYPLCIFYPCPRSQTRKINYFRSYAYPMPCSVPTTAIFSPLIADPENFFCFFISFYFTLYNCTVPIEFVPWEIRVAFPLGKPAATESRYLTYCACWVC